MASIITPYCISAYIVYQSSESSLYLLLKRCGKYFAGTWQMISGGIEAGESASQAVLREIREETGLIPQTLYSADAVETFYMLSHDKIAFVPVFVAFVDNLKVSLSPTEHDAYEWLSFENARDRLVWAEQRRVICHIHNTCVMKNPNELLRVSINGK